MLKSKDGKKVSISLLKVIMKYRSIDKAMRNFGTDVPIYNSEIHIVSIIAKNPGIHVRGLAELLEIASASVSETVRKLIKKDLVYKEKDPKNLSRLSLFVTKKGEIAHKEHLRYHELLDDMITTQLQNASDEEIDFLTDFLSSLSEELDGFEENI